MKKRESPRRCKKASSKTRKTAREGGQGCFYTIRSRQPSSSREAGWGRGEDVGQGETERERGENEEESEGGRKARLASARVPRQLKH